MQTSVAMTDVGRVRKVNQDYVYASDTPVGNLPNLYIVADGMGGHKAGDLASSYAVQTIVEAISRSVETRPALILQKAIRYANYRLYEKSEEREEYHGMGTTLVVLTVYKDEALAANIGDSRLYEISQKQIRQISEDHSLVAELVRKGELSATEARRHPDKNIIKRAGTITDRTVDEQLFYIDPDGNSNASAATAGSIKRSSNAIHRHTARTKPDNTTACGNSSAADHDDNINNHTKSTIHCQ